MVDPLYIVSLYYDCGRVTGANKRFDELGVRMLEAYPGDCTIIAPRGHRPAWCPEHRFIGIRPYQTRLGRLISWLALSAAVYRLPPGILYSDFQPAPILAGWRHKRLQLIHDLRNWTAFGRGGLGALSTLFQRYQLQGADAVVTVSEASKDDIVAKCAVPAERVIVSYNGLADTYRIDPSVQRDVDLVYVATFEPRKNHMRLLEAVEKLPEVNSLLLIGRDLGSRAEVEAYIRRSSTLSQCQISIVDSVDEAEMARVYQRAKVFVSPSLLEGFGMPLLEAAACGARIACSDLAVFREICGNAAVYFDPTDVDALAESLRLTLASTSARALDVERFRWRRITRELIASINAQVGAPHVGDIKVEIHD